MTLNRRSLLQGFAGLAASGLFVPDALAAEPVKRFWRLDGTMFEADADRGGLFLPASEGVGVAHDAVWVFHPADESRVRRHAAAGALLQMTDGMRPGRPYVFSKPIWSESYLHPSFSGIPTVAR